MQLLVPCPTCRQVLRVPEEYAGRSGKCRKCQVTFTLPVEQEVKADIPEPPDLSPTLADVQITATPIAKQTAAPPLDNLLPDLDLSRHWLSMML